MTDQALRELERRWRLSGSSEHEALFLRERLRVGALSVRRAELASYLGYPAAREVVTVEVPEDFSGWLVGLVCWEPDPRSRAALAVARAVLPLFDPQGLEAKFAARPRRALEALERWVDCPCESCLAQVDKASVHARTTARLLQGGGESAEVSLVASLVAVYAGLCTGSALDPSLDSTAHYLPVVARLSLEVRPEGMLRSAVQAELVPWALGYHDPVREPLEARPGQP